MSFLVQVSLCLGNERTELLPAVWSVTDLRCISQLSSRHVCNAAGKAAHTPRPAKSLESTVDSTVGTRSHSSFIHSETPTGTCHGPGTGLGTRSVCALTGYHCFQVSLTLWLLRLLTALSTSRDLLGLKYHRKGGPGRGSRCQAAGRMAVACRPGPQHLHW